MPFTGLDISGHSAERASSTIRFCDKPQAHVACELSSGVRTCEIARRNGFSGKPRRMRTASRPLREITPVARAPLAGGAAKLRQARQTLEA